MAGDETQRQQLGDYIRMQRQMADLSLRRMAELTQVSNAYLSQIERGLHQPSLRVLRAIAEALNMSAEVLLAHGGLLDAPADGAAARPAGSTERAILSDPDLSDDERDALLRVYRSFRHGRTSA